MQLGVFAKLFQGDIEDNFAAVSKNGLACVQYNLSIAGLETVPDKIPQGILSRIRQGAEANDIGLSAISGTFNIAHPDPDYRKSMLRRFPLLAGSAADMGIPTVTLSTGTRNPHDLWAWHPHNTSQEAWTDSVAALRTISTIATNEGVKVAFEPELANVVSTPKLARQMLDEVDSPALGIVFDAANIIDPENPAQFRIENIIHESIEALAEDILLVHAKELRPDRSDAAPGNGMLPWTVITEALAKAKYEGPLIMHGLQRSEVPFGISTLSSALRGNR